LTSKRVRTLELREDPTTAAAAVLRRVGEIDNNGWVDGSASGAYAQIGDMDLSSQAAASRWSIRDARAAGRPLRRRVVVRVLVPVHNPYSGGYFGMAGRSGAAACSHHEHRRNYTSYDEHLSLMPISSSTTAAATRASNPQRKQG
jgi:hypothetical protein